RTPAGGTGSARASSPGSEEEAGSEVLSHCSSASESTSPADEGPGSEAASEQGQEEEVEDRLKEHMDNLLDKSAKARQAALQGLRLALSCKTLPELLLERRLTLTDSLEKCLKKAGGSQQMGCCGWSSLSCPKGLLAPLGVVGPLWSPVHSSVWHLHGSCGLTGKVSLLQDLVSCLSCLEGIFSPSSTGEGGSAPAQHGPLHCSALQSWSLLLTICPPSHLRSILDNRWLQLPPLLTSSSVALRILAGETIALLFELAQDLEEDLCHQDTEFLCTQLKVLATESNKYRAKTDRRRQRSIFRDILRFIESGEYQEETIRFGLECMYLDSWARQRTYQAFKEVLGSGIHHHLQNNELLREIFGLGPPLVLDAAALKASKVSRFEKHLYNSAAFKARTKARSRVRDKRADVL
ncbi:IFRD2 regulator, partial [Hypocryptadius cinnamomeus]|nr:IFRD2 regulator [Hypocryptadius cinnamomeus]